MRNKIDPSRDVPFSFGDFDESYLPWQNRLRADSIYKWLIEARNRIVKGGELEASGDFANAVVAGAGA